MFKWKQVLPVAGAFVVYQFYKLYETGNSISWRFLSVKPISVSNSKIRLQVIIRILNPQRSKYSIRGVLGTLSHEGKKLADFTISGFKLNAGLTDLPIIIEVDNASAIKEINRLSAMGSSVPDYDLKMKVKIPFFTIPYTDKIPARDLTTIYI